MIGLVIGVLVRVILAGVVGFVAILALALCSLLGLDHIQAAAVVLVIAIFFAVERLTEKIGTSADRFDKADISN